MSAIKRSSWIEGITQSNRILRDVAEIVTTAIKDDMGQIDPTQNAALIYPRPFEEKPVSRGRLIRQTAEVRTATSESATLTGTTGYTILATDVDDTTVVVKSSDGLTTYVSGTDYSYDAATNTVARIGTGAILDGETVTIEFDTVTTGNYTRDYVPVLDHQEEIRLIGTTPVTLLNGSVYEGSVVVKNADNTITYIAGTDYTYDANANAIARIEGGAIVNDEAVNVSYATTFFQILDSIPVVVEEVLTLTNPDREIASSEYVIDYVDDTITFFDVPPTDAEYFHLEFTEYTSVWNRLNRIFDDGDALTDPNTVKLTADPLDVDGKTFKLPTGTGEIMKAPTEKKVVASSTGGSIASGKAPYTFDGTALTVVFNDAPTPEVDSSLEIEFKMYTDSTLTTTTLVTAPLVEDTSDTTGKTYVLSGTYNKANTNEPHKVSYETNAITPKLFKHLADTNAGVAVVSDEHYTVDFTNAIVTFIDDPDAGFSTSTAGPDFLASFTARGEDDLNQGLDKIKDRIVLRMITEPEQAFTNSDPNNKYGAVDTTENLEMFVEFIKPERLINPETGLDRYVDWKGMQHQTQMNNHYVMTRMFNQWDDFKQAPQDVVYDETGAITNKGAYVSDWSKYSWFQDWKEYMVDELDDDPGISNVQEGIILKEVEIDGMTDEFPIQFWISTNNNRISMVLMGDPSLDQDNFLTSFGYFGRVHPFYDEECKVKLDDMGNPIVDANGDYMTEEIRTYFENDVKGNFALTTGSSTLPAAIGTPPKGEPILEEVVINKDTTTGALVPGDLYDYTTFSYLVSYLTEVGESKPTPISGDGSGRLGIANGTIANDPTVSDPAQGLSIRLKFHLPKEATGYRIYRYHEANVLNFNTEADKYDNYKMIASIEKLDRERTIEYVDDGAAPMYKETYDATTGAVTNELIVNSWDTFYAKYTSAVSTARSFEAVVRDKFTGAIVDVKFSYKYGRETATGVNDIMMFQTRSGLKFQKHSAAFITTEEFIRKEKSGQSRWTGKFHLSPIYIEHSYDKQRGWLDGVMAVDDSGIEHLDELIVDKDTPKEEVYKFFRVSAPYSMFNNSPNYAYGIAIIKNSMKWN